MASLREIIDYSKANPDTDYAKRAYMLISRGDFDTQARQEGIDLSFAGRNTVTAKEPSYTEKVGSAFQAGKEKLIQGITTPQRATNPLELIQGGLKGAAGAAEALLSPLAPALEPVGKVIQATGDKIAEIPAVQNFANSEAGKVTERVAEGVLDATAVMGTLAGARIAPKAATQATKATAKSVSDFGSNLKAGVKDIQEGAYKTAENMMAKPLSKPVANVLKDTKAVDFDKYVKIAKDASESFKNQTPLEYAGTRAQTALDQIQRKISEAGRQKRQVLGAATVEKMAVGNIVVRFRANLDKYLSSKTAIEGDSKLIHDVMKEAKKLGNNPMARDVDKFIDFVQDKIYSSTRDLTVPVTDDATAALRRITGQLNESLKAQLPENYRGLNQRLSSLYDLRNELNAKLGKEGERGGSLMKRIFSPSDNNTKLLFDSIYKETGIDLVNEATLARFAMETIGDARQASMLEQLQLPHHLSTDSAVMFGMKKLSDKFNQPDQILGRARELTKGGAPAPKKPIDQGLGLSTKKDTAVGTSPAAVAKNLNGEDIALVQDFVNDPSLANLMKLQPMIEAMGIDKLDPVMTQRFLEDVILERNSGGAVLVEGKAPKVKTVKP